MKPGFGTRTEVLGLFQTIGTKLELGSQFFKNKNWISNIFKKNNILIFFKEKEKH
jgi:hypothetical protein